ncbi:hypothetical protein B0I37DRAFT_373828 [Chaetomium sp. MPI-CAGE-AT-0009]|nr:hypothetical protein B0I37DRAFT_373828 [Chaetomium sp. MPI-CAGE-AT-0009]
MERPSGTTSPSAGPWTAPVVQDQGESAEGSATDGPQPGPKHFAFQGAGLFVRRDKDIIEDAKLERRDTTESSLSDFCPQRSNTDWSIAGSTATDLTDLNSPDVAFADEGSNIETEVYASSPRRSGLFPRPVALQKRPAIRVPAVSSEPDKSRASPYSSSPDALTLRHRRLEQMASRKSSLSQYTVPDAPDKPPSGARDASAIDPRVTTDDAIPEHVDSHDGENTGSGTIGMTQGEESAVPQDETDVDAEVGDDASTPGKAASDKSVLEDAESSADAVAPGPHERPRSRYSEESDRSEDRSGRSTPRPHDNIIHEVCDLVLQQAFGVHLHHVALTGAASSVYESVSYCLDELSHVVLNSGLSNTGIVMDESTWGRTGTNSVPIWPAGGVADGISSGGGGGGGQGNGGGSRKRFNAGDGHGGGAGDGSPGGGKRQKVSQTQQQSPDMHFSCPFRKRNPIRFNVRDFQSCAVQSFPDVPQLKRHVKNFHKQTAVLPFTCPRCRRAMGTQNALNEHISVGKDQICDPQAVPPSADPEDGITPGIEEALNERKADGKIDGWASLWGCLFPGDIDIPEPDFVPLTELDEVYAQFNTDHSMGQLRQRIQEGLGPAGNAETLFGVFKNHIDSVFEACRLKSGGAASSRRRLRIQTPRQQVASRRSSVLLTPGRQGSGRSESSLSSPVATPHSTKMLGNLDQPFMAEPQPRMPYVPPTTGGYPSSAVDSFGGMMLSFFPGDNTGGGQTGQPVTVPPPTQVHLGFGSQDQNTAGAVGGQLGHGQRPRLLPTDSGLALNTAFPGQRAASFSPVLPLGPQNAYAPMNFGQQMHDLCLRPVPPGLQGAQGVEGQGFSPTDPGMVPAITNSYYNTQDPDEDGYELVHRNGEWM